MKLSLTSLGLLALAGSSHAQYFSAGWSPGQKVDSNEANTASPTPEETPTAPAGKPAPFSFSNLFDINRLLTSEPAVAIFNKVGVNITERVEAAASHKIWDERVELITDDNFKDLIVNEALTEQQEKERAWLLVISAASAKQDGISKYLDRVFDAAFNATQLAEDLPNIKWGRIDYLNVTYLTTKWAIWQAPYLVVIQDRGNSLYFFKPQHLRLRDDALREFLRTEGWKVTPPWSTAYAPGGDREYIMEFFAVWLTKVYNVFVLVPKWVLLLASGSIASVLIGLLHRPAAQQQPPAPTPRPRTQPAAPPAAGPSSAPVPAPASASKTPKTPAAPPSYTDSDRESPAAPAKRTSARQRKNKKA